MPAWLSWGLMSPSSLRGSHWGGSDVGYLTGVSALLSFFACISNRRKFENSLYMYSIIYDKQNFDNGKIFCLFCSATVTINGINS